MLARIGDRHAVPVSQNHGLFGWLTPALIQRLGRAGKR